MPRDAVYCPACGAASGALPVEPLGSAVEASSAEVALGGGSRGRRLWLLPAAVVVVIALVVIVAVAGDGSSDPAAAPPTSAAPTTAAPTTALRPSTSAARPTTTTTFSQYVVAPYPDAAGVVVYETTNDGDVLRIDLGTGTVDRRFVATGPRIAGPWAVIARKGGYVLSDGSYDDHSPIYAVLDGAGGPAVPIAAWTPAESAGSAAPRAIAAAEPDEVWTWNDTNQGGPTTIQRVRIDGAVTAGPVTLSRYASVVGADGPGTLLVQANGGLYRATVDGQSLHLERVSDTVPIAYSSGAFLQVACDDSLQCHLAVVDRATGTADVVPGDVIDHVVPSYDTSLSPDGRWLVHAIYENDPQPKLNVYDLTTGDLVMRDDVTPTSYGLLGTAQSAQFTADGRWLVYFNLNGGIRLWKVGSTDQPVTFNVPLTNVSMISLAPAT